MGFLGAILRILPCVILAAVVFPVAFVARRLFDDVLLPDTAIPHGLLTLASIITGFFVVAVAFVVLFPVLVCVHSLIQHYLQPPPQQLPSPEGMAKLRAMGETVPEAKRKMWAAYRLQVCNNARVLPSANGLKYVKES